MPRLVQRRPSKTAASHFHPIGCYLVSTFSASAGRSGYFILCAWRLAEARGTVGVAVFLLVVSLVEIATSAIAGVLVDRVDRRRITIASDIGRMVLLLFAGFAADQVYLPYVIWISGCLFSFCDRLSQTASHAMIPALTAISGVTNLNPIVFLVMQIGNLAAALLLGALLDASDMTATFAAISAFFLASALMLVVMDRRGSSRIYRLAPSDGSSLRLEARLIGFSLIYAQLYGSAVLVSVAGSGYVLGELHGTAADFAFVEAAWSFGSLLGALILWSPSRGSHGYDWASRALVATALLLFLLRFTGMLWVYLAFLLMGLAHNLGRVCVETVLQASFPDAVLGRAKGAMHTAGASLGLLVFGFAALGGSGLSASTMFATYGVAMIPGVIAVLLLRPRLKADQGKETH